MPEDLESILQNWPYDPGSVQVRAIVGDDGRSKLQLRLDLGLLQMETTGRPDGQRPLGCESLLEHYEKLSKRAEKEGCLALFKLKLEDCLKLQQEAIQYHHRYLAFFQLQNFASVIADAERNLRLLDFIFQHAETPEMATTFQQFRPYVLMMLTRARGTLAIQNEEYTLALKHIEWGIHEIRAFLQANFPPESVEQSPELHSLQSWFDEVKDQRPLTAREKLQKQMLDAVKNEDYERAARLRDALEELR